MADTRSLLAKEKFPLLRRFSIASLAAMLITAAILVLLYRQDQFTEHKEIATQNNEKAAIHLMHLLGDQIYTLITNSNGLDTQALRANPNIDLFTTAMEMVREYDILKLKIFNLSGATIYSSARDEIGRPSSHPDLLAKALRGQVLHQLDFHKTFLNQTVELHDRYISSTYIPLTHAGKHIGVIEFYTDTTPIFNRINAYTIRIALIVFCAFTALYAALFFSVLRTDRAVIEWQKVIAAREGMLRTIIGTIHDLIWLKNPDGIYLACNSMFERFFGAKEAEIVGKTDYDFVDKELADFFREHDRKAMDKGGPSVNEEEVTFADDGYRALLETVKTPMYDKSGQLIGVLGIAHDITERKRAEGALHEQEEFFRLIAENVEDFIAVLDLEGRRLYNSPSYARFLGDIEYIKGTDSFAEIHPDDRERIKQLFKETVQSGIGHQTEFRFVLPNGSIRHMESRGGLIKNSQGKVLRVIVVSHDITARREAENEIHNLAFYDALTKLPNRRLLNDRLAQAMAASKRNGLYCALMFMDLDNFKPLNDTHGHGVGDLLLMEVARRITNCVREVDTVARFGGDEFVVILSELDVDKVESLTQASIVAEKIRTTLAEPYLLKIQQKGKAETTIEHHCTSSIGVVLFINHEASAEDILKWADMAMYQAKEGGRNQIRFYDSKA